MAAIALTAKLLEEMINYDEISFIFDRHHDISCL